MNDWRQWCDNRQNGNNNNNNDNASVISSTISANTMINNEKNNNGNNNDNNNKNNGEKKIKVMADFVKDVTLPDRTYYPIDTVLTKTWKMKNNGEHEWGNNVELVFFKGNKVLTLEQRYPVINAKPGQEVEVSAVIKTPDKPGRYCSYYRLQRNGEYFGPRVWVDIFAVDEENTEELNKNVEPKWKKHKNKGKNKNKNKNSSKVNKDKQQDKMIKLEKKEAKLEAKQLKLEAKQSKLASKLDSVSKELNNQNENENSSKLVNKQNKLKKQQSKIQQKVVKIKNKSSSVQRHRQSIESNQNQNQNQKPLIDEQQLLDDIANAAVQDLDFDQKQQARQRPQQQQQVINQLNQHQIHPIIPPQIPVQAMSCVCGTSLHKTTPVQAYNNGAEVNCDVCQKFCPPTTTIYHCPMGKTRAHAEGYDICCSCAEYQMQGFMPHPQQPQIPQQPQVPPQPQGIYPVLQQIPPPLNPNHQLQPLINNPVGVQHHQSHQQIVIPPMNVPIAANVIPQPEPFIYQRELEQLRAMGFNDDDKIKAELIQQKGNVQRVANRLLQQ